MIMGVGIRLWAPLLLGFLSAPGLQAQSLDELRNAIAEGNFGFDFRYRFEYVDQDGIDKEAEASTLRSRFSYTTAPLRGFEGGFEVDHVVVVGAEKYNSLDNEKTQYPVVADPEGLDLNQAFIRYRGDSFAGTGGRQRINHDRQRFIGGVAWRQNEQTYDSARVTYDFGETFSLDYSYVWNVKRIFGPDGGGPETADWDANTHLFYGTWNLAENHELSPYVYLLDFDNGNGPVNSNATFGVDYRGQLGKLALKGSFARQSDYGDNPLNYDAYYLLLQGDFDLGPVTLQGGYELLGSDDGDTAFRTPLATLHLFQGWADKFLATPDDGIEDVYAGLRGKAWGWSFGGYYHHFSADDGGDDYGDEINLIATYPITERVEFLLKFAHYEADDFATDTTKFWTSLQLKL